MADILLCYERTDRQRVEPIVALLETRGWSVGWEPADAIASEREWASAGCILAAWSFDSVESDTVFAAASHGLARGVLVSVSIDFSRPPRELDAAPSLALAGWTGDPSSPKAQELLAAVGDLLAHATAAPAPAAEPPEPPVQFVMQSAVEPVAPSPARSLGQSLAALPAVQPRAGDESDHGSRPLASPAEPEDDIDREDVYQPRSRWPRAFESEPEPRRQPEFQLDPEDPPEDDLYPEEASPPEGQWPPAFESEREDRRQTAFHLDPEPPAGDADDLEPLESVPALVHRDDGDEPVWAYPDDTGDDDQGRPRLPPVLLRERGVPRTAAPDEVPAPAPARGRRLGFGLVVGCAALAVAAAAGTLWIMQAPGPSPGASTPGSEVAIAESTPEGKPPPSTPVVPPSAAVQPESKSQESRSPQEARHPEAKSQAVKQREVKAQEIQPTRTALPKVKDVEIEDILGQATPRVEELLADVRRLTRVGDIRGIRQVLGAAPETSTSGSLTFLLAETYDPNVLPPTMKAALADPERARALYRKARDLGDGRAQARLDALKTS